jgi:hypothetical protein
MTHTPSAARGNADHRSERRGSHEIPATTRHQDDQPRVASDGSSSTCDRRDTCPAGRRPLHGLNQNGPITAAIHLTVHDLGLARSPALSPSMSRLTTQGRPRDRKADRIWNASCMPRAPPRSAPSRVPTCREERSQLHRIGTATASPSPVSCGDGRDEGDQRRRSRIVGLLVRPPRTPGSAQADGSLGPPDGGTGRRRPVTRGPAREGPTPLPALRHATSTTRSPRRSDRAEPRCPWRAPAVDDQLGEELADHWRMLEPVATESVRQQEPFDAIPR